MDYDDDGNLPSADSLTASVGSAVSQLMPDDMKGERKQRRMMVPARIEGSVPAKNGGRVPV